jgi:hypothetical protein
LRGVGEPLSVDLLPQTTTAEGMLCALMVGARYVEWVAACAELRLEVARGPLLHRLDLRGLDRLVSVDVAGWSQTEGEGPRGRHRTR